MNHIPRLGRAWRRTFWAFYDHFGLMIILSLIWLATAVTVFLIPAVTFALYYAAHLIVRDRQVKLKHLFHILPKYIIRSTFLALTFIISLFLLLLNIRFYLSHLGIFGIILAGISFWLFLFVLLISIYIFPLLCLNEGYKKSIQHSSLLVLDNLKFSVAAAIFIIILLCLEIILPIIGIGLLAIFSQEVFLELQARYDQEIKITEPKRTLRELLRPWETY